MTLLDVIGDVHGGATALEALLVKLGYTYRHGAWRAPEGRCAAFVGDFIDGGPENLRVVEIVRAMRDAGSATAVMGNHELNALQYHTRSVAAGDFLRPHTEKNARQHASYLKEAAERPDAHAAALDFFLSLPMWAEVAGLRIVHACWSGPHIATARTRLGDEARLSADDLPRTIEGGDLNGVVETILKSPEAPLPPGISFQDSYGQRRTDVRLAWWRHDARSWRDVALLDDALLQQLPDGPLPELGIPLYQITEAPAVFGHYRRRPGQPVAPVSENAICVDYTEELVAFRQTDAGAVGTFVTTPRR